MMRSLRRFLFDPILCGFIVIFLLTIYGSLGILLFFPILILEKNLDVIIFVTCELWRTHYHLPIHLRMMMSLGVKTRLLLIKFTIITDLEILPSAVLQQTSGS